MNLKKAPIPNLGKKVFLVGIGEEEITVFRQQVRALNLAQRIHESAKQGQELNVAVVGAGVSGLTLAAGLVSLGHRVDLFEKQVTPMYLQRGCETRYLHPYIYDWPAAGSQIPLAELPILGWRAGSAASVCRQIENGFNEIARIGKDSEKLKLRAHTMVRVDPKAMEVEWEVINPRATADSDDFWEAEPYVGKEQYQIICMSVGFGLEYDVDDDENLSYWRNDSFNQVLASSYGGSVAEYWVSGTGDGALVDIQRLTIKDYDQSRVIFDVWYQDSDLRTSLNDRLSTLHKKVVAEIDKGISVYDAIEKCEHDEIYAKL